MTEGVLPVFALAEIVTGTGTTDRLNVIFRDKYKIEYGIVMFIERLSRGWTPRTRTSGLRAREVLWNA